MNKTVLSKTTADNNGGAITNFKTLLINNSKIINLLSTNQGGIIYNKEDQVEIYNSLLNQSKTETGGAIYNNPSCKLTLKNSTIVNAVA